MKLKIIQKKIKVVLLLQTKKIYYKFKLKKNNMNKKFLVKKIEKSH
jgi:hypothetical protein